MSTAALVTALLAALGAACAAALHGPAALIAWLAALTAFAIALAAAASAKRLGAPGNLTEPRVERGPSRVEPLPSDAVDRRGVLGRIWGLAIASVSILTVVPFVALARRPVTGGTAWSAGARLVTTDGKPLRSDDLAVGGIATVFPEGHVGAPESAALLVRLLDDALRVTPDRAGWSPHGNVAYSKICTHAGCPVAIYRKASSQLYCPCHQSVFDVLDQARPVSGPATRALPQLALAVDGEGYLVARGDFSEPVGPDTWWRTL